MATGQNVIGPWFALAPTGTIQLQTNPVLRAGLIATGWIGFATKADAEAWLKITPAIPGASAVAGAAGQAVSAASSATGAIADLPKYLAAASKWVTSRANVVRVLKVAGGVALVLMGVQKLSAVQSAERGVASVAKVAAL